MIDLASTAENTIIKKSHGKSSSLSLSTNRSLAILPARSLFQDILISKEVKKEVD